MLYRTRYLISKSKNFRQPIATVLGGDLMDSLLSASKIINVFNIFCYFSFATADKLEKHNKIY